MQQEMKVVEGRVKVQYPWDTHLIRRMKNNRKQAAMVQDRIRQDLKKKGQLQQFNIEIQKKLDTGSAVIVKEKEIQMREKQGKALNFLT